MTVLGNGTLGQGRIASLQVGGPRTHRWLGRELTTSIFKSRVDGPVALAGVNLAGDDQADRQVHGGKDKVAYAYAREDLDWWSAELGREVEDGSMGENLTLLGIDVTGAVVGEHWRVGTALLQVSEPRTPCWKLGLRMNDARFPRRFAAARRPGAHLRLLEAGVLEIGDAVTVVQRPGHGVTLADVVAVYFGDSDNLAPLLEVPELSAHWREWAAHRTVWHLDEERKGIVSGGNVA